MSGNRSEAAAMGPLPDHALTRFPIDESRHRRRDAPAALIDISRNFQKDDK
jgi:hypothetical protein